MLKYIIALVLIVHGMGHVMGFIESWTKISVGFSEQPWLLSGGVTMESPVGRAFGLLWLVAMIGFVGAGLGLLFYQEWWPPLAVVAAVISLVAIIPWWKTVTPGSGVGATLVDLLVLVALLLPWGDRIVQAIH